MKKIEDLKDWQEGINQVLHGDCLDLMRMMPDKCIDLVLTDPPYRNESENQPTKDMRNNGGMKNFGDKPTKELFDEIFRVSKNQIIWGVNNFDLPNYKGFIVWKKKTISINFTMSMAEIAFLSEELGTTSKIIEFAPQDPMRKHPTQKPLELGRWCLENYGKGCKTIFDPFAGSFTFARAAKDMGFDFLACDREEDYCRIGEERLRQECLF